MRNIRSQYQLRTSDYPRCYEFVVCGRDELVPKPPLHLKRPVYKADQPLDLGAANSVDPTMLTKSVEKVILSSAIHKNNEVSGFPTEDV